MDKYYDESREENLHCSHSNMAFILVFFGTFAFVVLTNKFSFFFFAFSFNQKIGYGQSNFKSRYTIIILISTFIKKHFNGSVDPRI